MDPGESITQWLHLWREGDQAAIERVTSLIYSDLRRLAAYHLQGESNAVTLQPTALVHEAYLRIAAVRTIDWQGRAHFISVVTQMMRRILVDHARARRAAKRDSTVAVPFSFIAGSPGKLQTIDILAVDQALERMSAQHPRCTQIVEMRFFGDLQFQEIAQVLDISPATVERDWRFARAWLRKRLTNNSYDSV